MFATLALAFPPTASATVYQWDGGAGTSNWQTGTNWSPDGTIGAFNTTGGHRLNVNSAQKLVHSAAEGNTVYAVAANRGLVIGSGALGGGTLEITGGSFSTLGSASGDVVGNQDNSTGRLIVNGGTFVSTNAGLGLGIGAGTNRVAILDVLAGTATMAAVNMNTNTATINLTGGTLEVNNISRTAGTGSLYLGGGTLKARQNNTAFVSGLSGVYVQAGGAIIDTSTFNVTIGNILRDGGGGGGLTKSGAGILTLTAAATFTGPTTINAGTLQLGDGTTDGAITSSSGITDNGTLKFNLAGNQTYTAAIGGTGSLTKSGNGILTLAGTNSYAGTTTVSGGTLNLTGTLTSDITVAGGANLGGEGATTGSLAFTGSSLVSFDPTTSGATDHLRASSITATGATLTFAPVATSGPVTGMVIMESTGGSPIAGTIGVEFVGNSRLTLSFNGTNTQLLADLVPASLVWKGDDPTNPTFWDTGATTNWFNTTSSTADKFYAGDNVVFNDDNLLADPITVSVQSAVSPTATTFGADSKSYTVGGAALAGSGTISFTGAAPVTINSVISTSGGLSKTGPGTLVLNGANTFGGTASFTNGTVELGNAAALGSNLAGTSVSGTGVLDVKGLNLGTEVITISGDGSGSGAFINTGLQQINALGRLVLAADASVGGVNRWDLRNATPTLDMGGFKLTKKGINYVGLVGVAVSNPGSIEVAEGTFSIQTTTTMGGSSANVMTVKNAATLDFFQSGTWTPVEWTLDLESGALVTASSGTAVWNGPVTGLGALTKGGASALTLAGTTANTYAGGTTVNAGTLNLQKSPGVDAIPGDALVAGTGTVTNLADNQIADTATITVDGPTAMWSLGGKTETVQSVHLSGAYGVNKGCVTGVAGKLTVPTLQVAGGGVVLNSSGGPGLESYIEAGAVTNTGGTWVFGVLSGTQSLRVGTGGLTIGNGSTITLNAVSGTADNYISLGGDVTVNASASTNAISPGANGAGHLHLNATRIFNVDDGLAVPDLTLGVPLADGTGTGGLDKQGAGALRLSAANTYTGPTTVSGGELDLVGGSQASPITVQTGAFLGLTIGSPVTSTGTLTLDAGSKIRLVGTPTLPSYTLFTASAISGTPDLETPIPGYALVVAGGHTLKLNSTAGGFAVWISSFGLATADQDPQDDPDNDGLSNLLEFVLNGNPAQSDSSILPRLAITATDFEFTYQRRDDSLDPETVQDFEWGTTLGTWPGIITVPATSGTVGAATVTVTPGSPDDLVTDTVRISIPKTEAGAAAKLFGRLKVTKP